MLVEPTTEDLLERAAANSTEVDTTTSLLHELFEDTAAKTPNAPAVIVGERIVTYRELQRAAHAISGRLVAEGIEPEERVAILARPGWEQAAAALGTTMAGAAFVPVNPSWPAQRQREVIEIASARFVLIGEGFDCDPDTFSACCAIRLDAIADAPRPAVEVTPDQMAYIIFTSGSTGVPKGVVIEHRAATTTILDVNRRFAVGPQDRVLGISEFTFDLAIWDLFGMFAAGGALVVIEEEGHARRNPERWYEKMAQHAVTVWNSVPALMSMLVQHAEDRGLPVLERLRVVMLSGDWIPLDLPDRLRALAPTARQWSLGGATEASIWSNWFEIAIVDPTWKSIPYGFPLANQRFYVLNAELAPCPRFVPGDLYIAGHALAREYWGRPDLTEASFIRHPGTGERLYRTGDLGRYLPGGIIDFLGRRDQQVKVGGYRIELEEIEAKLLTLPGIVAAAACVRSEAARAVVEAAVVCSDGSRSDYDVAGGLGRLLPAYMVPSRIMRVSTLPLGANGKIDREGVRALLEQSTLVPARTSLEVGFETEIAGLLANVLGTDRIDVERNFFEVGATSLDLVRFHGALERRCGHKIEPTLVFEYSNIRALARQLGRVDVAENAPDAPERREKRLAHQAARRSAKLRNPMGDRA